MSPFLIRCIPILLFGFQIIKEPLVGLRLQFQSEFDAVTLEFVTG